MNQSDDDTPKKHVDLRPKPDAEPFESYGDEQIRIEEKEGLNFDEMFDMTEICEELKKKFGLTEKSAKVAWYISIGSTPNWAVTTVYNYSDRRNIRTRSTELLKSQAFQSAISYLSGKSMVENHLDRMKMRLLNWGQRKLYYERNPSAAVGIWNTLVKLSFSDKLPDGDKRVADKLGELAEAYNKSQARKRGVEHIPLKSEKDREEKEDDAKH